MVPRRAASTRAKEATARATPPTPRIEVGRSQRVVYVDGLTAYAEPVPLAPEVAPAPGTPAASEMAREES